MEKEIIKAVSNLGFGIIGFWFSYLLLKWMLGKLTSNLDQHTDSLKSLLNDHKDFKESFKEILDALKRLNGKK